MFNLIDDWTEPGRKWIENQYDWFEYKYFGSDHQKSAFYLSVIATFFLYWIVGGLYTIIDIFEKPKFLLRYKIQYGKSQVNKKQLIRLFKRVLINQLMGILIGYYEIFYLSRTRNARIPKLSRFLYEWTCFILIREILFYYSHRLLHHPLIYKHIHKTHHEWQTPIAISAMYCHPIENFLSNAFPVIIGPKLMSSHNLVEFLWISYAIVLTLNDHSGLHLPFTFSPVFHDFHHLKFNVNYGILGILDWLHGTDRLFRQSKYFQNHKMYFTLTPPKKIE